MTVEGSGSVREKIRKTLLIVTTLFHENGLLSLLPPAYPAVLLEPLDVIITVYLENPLPVSFLLQVDFLYNITSSH